MKDTIDLVTIHETFLASIDNLNSKGELLLKKTNGIDNHLQQLNNRFDSKVECWNKDIIASMMDFTSRQESTINDFDTLWHSELNQQIAELKIKIQSEYNNFRKDQLRRWELFIENEKKLFEEKSENYRSVQDKLISQAKTKLNNDSEKLLKNTKQLMIEKQSGIIDAIGENHAKAITQLEQDASRGKEQIDRVESELTNLIETVDEKHKQADQQLIQLSKKSQEIKLEIETRLGETSIKVESMMRDLKGKYENMLEEAAANFAEKHSQLTAERENELGILKAESKNMLDKIDIKNNEFLELLEAENAKQIGEFRIKLLSEVPKAIGPFEVELKDHIEKTNSKITATANEQKRIKSEFDDKFTNYKTKLKEVLVNILDKKEEQLSLQFKCKFENLNSIINQNNSNSSRHFKSIKSSQLAAQNEIKKAKRERRLLAVLILLTLGINGLLFAHIAL
jgi:hypothetical protein